MRKNSQYFGIRRAAELCDLKPAMVDYLCRSNLLVPSARYLPGRGSPRLYSFGDIVMLRALAHLLRSGISVKKLKVALQRTRRRHREITPTSLPGKYLITDGKHVFFRDRKDAIEDVTADGQFVFHFVIRLERVRDDVAARLEKAS